MVTYLEQKKRTSTLATVFLRQLFARLSFSEFTLCYLHSLFVFHSAHTVFGICVHDFLHKFGCRLCPKKGYSPDDKRHNN